MTFQLVSDLHLEFPINSAYFARRPLTRQADVLIMAGDIMNYELKDEKFLDHVSKTFEKVYWVSGNHEHYGGELLDKFSYEIPVRDNIYYVNNRNVQIEDTSFLFSTLWSEISPLQSFSILKALSDFEKVKYNGKKLTVAQYNFLHKESVAFIEQELEKQRHKTVVVTHHVPVFGKTVEDVHKNSPLSSAFHTDLSDLIFNFAPDVWAFGHTHYNSSDFKIGKTLMVTNQLGYQRRNNPQNLGFDKSFNPGKIISI